MGASTSTDVLARLVRAVRHVVDCSDGPPTSGCSVFSVDGHRERLLRALAEAEAHLSDLPRRPS